MGCFQKGVFVVELGVALAKPSQRCNCKTRSAGNCVSRGRMAMPATCQLPQRHDPAPCPAKCLHSRQTRRSSWSRSRSTSLSANTSPSFRAIPLSVNLCRRASKVPISALFIADEFGQHQRSGSSDTAMEESCFSNTAGEGTAKTDESSSGIAEAATVGTAETAKTLEIAVSSVLAVPPWRDCEIAAFARSAQVIISAPS